MNGLSYIREMKNTFWIILFRVIRVCLSFVISLLTARYLGPERYGISYYVTSLAGFFVPVALLGLNDTLVRELSEHTEKEGEILGTSLVMSVSASVISAAVMILFAYLLNRNDSTTVWFCGLYSISLLFQNYELITCWFQTKLQSKYPSAAVVLAFTVSSAYRVFLLVTHKGILWFAMTTVIDYAMIALILFVCYRVLNGPRLSFSAKTGKELLNRSKYYILTSIIVASFSTVDKIMLKSMFGEVVNGYYSGAYSLAGSTSFLYAALIESQRPSIVSLAKDDSESFAARVKTLFSLMFWISFIQNLVFSMFGKLIVETLLGADYVEAVPVFRILTWFTTFSYIGAARNVWILATDNHRYLWRINLIGALSGIVMNFILIKRFGMIGAAVTAIITQFLTNYLTGYIFKDVRPVNDLLLQALNPKNILNYLGEAIAELRSIRKTI